ncbi:MAG: L,D-transpeptidase family protein, partial [Coriobacteriia bacterium]
TKQIIIITGATIGSASGKLAVYNKEGDHWVSAMDEVTANFGKNGLIDGRKRQTGNLETPTGIWTIGEFVFGLHPAAPSGTKMPYKPIKSNSYWSGERNSTYNSWVDHQVSGEHLMDADPQYEYAFNTGYNSLPNERVMGRGTAIFIHCFEPPGNALGKYTHGCIAIDRDNMVRLFKILDPAKNPTCAIGTLKEGAAASIWAY